MVWQQRVRSLTPAEFKRTYRMTLKTFNAVLRNIRPAIMSSVKSRKKARRDLGGAVAAELKLSMTLRYLAGGSYLDIYQMHGVSTLQDYILRDHPRGMPHYYGRVSFALPYQRPRKIGEYC